MVCFLPRRLGLYRSMYTAAEVLSVSLLSKQTTTTTTTMYLLALWFTIMISLDITDKVKAKTGKMKNYSALAL